MRLNDDLHSATGFVNLRNSKKSQILWPFLAIFIIKIGFKFAILTVEHILKKYEENIKYNFYSKMQQIFHPAALCLGRQNHTTAKESNMSSKWKHTGTQYPKNASFRKYKFI